MDAYMAVLRIIHIIAGSFWFGASVVFAFFVEPTAKALGPQAAPFMAHVAGKLKLPIVIAVTSIVNIIAGLLLYWRASGGLESEWVKSAQGTAFTIGGLAAMVAWVIGFTVSRPTIDKMNAVGQRLAAGDATAGPEMAVLAHRMRLAGRIGVALLVVATGAMAGARYF